ncbi:ScbR family autoregulator-binding transcription factor [Agromyces mediolanus]|uniref:ScbR family autoregulator-binding transcription factor n=1 Tax=Agromyces mediolanus TaxID=41986 RepID=UPI003834A568
MVQQERARLTRAKIMLGAAEVIRTAGYANATLNDIGAAAGVTKGALYFHFDSKEEIARALIEEQHRVTREAAAEILQLELSPVEHMLRLCMDLAVRLTVDPIVRAGIRLTTDSSTFDTPLLDPYRDWMATFEELARRAEAAGETNGRISPEVFARTLIPAYTGVQLVSETFTGRADLVDRIHDLWRVLLTAIIPTAELPAKLALADEVFTVPAPGRKRA